LLTAIKPAKNLHQTSSFLSFFPPPNIDWRSDFYIFIPFWKMNSSLSYPFGIDQKKQVFLCYCKISTICSVIVSFFITLLLLACMTKQNLK
jgi:hypothetical protein